MKVLIIEDDPGIVETISLTFQIRWPETELISTHSGEKGVAMVEAENPDMVILDLGLTDINGFEVLKQIRLFSAVPVLILTVRADESDVVKGLEWGADDYMVKPFRQLELMSRVKALTRRRSYLPEETPLVYGQFHFYPSTCQLCYGDKEIALTTTEGRIFHKLIENTGRVVTYADLAASLWGDEYPGTDASLQVHVHRLRAKIEADPAKPQVILTKSGIGYTMAKPV